MRAIVGAPRQTGQGAGLQAVPVQRLAPNADDNQ